MPTYKVYMQWDSTVVSAKDAEEAKRIALAQVQAEVKRASASDFDADEVAEDDFYTGQ